MTAILEHILLLLSNALIPTSSLSIPNGPGTASRTVTDSFLSAVDDDPLPAATNWPFPDYLPPPSIDPWYSPPSGWELASPGTPLRIRPHAYPTINIKHCRDTFQILYRSSDTHGNASWAVTTVFVPTSHPPPDNSTSTVPKSRPKLRVVSYQVPSDSVSPDAAPSFLLQAREPYGEMRDLLARGWLVAVPDYEGPSASYCAGKQAGYATLDGIRAIRGAAASPRLADFNLAPASSSSASRSSDASEDGEDGVDGNGDDGMRFAIWGYSGGGFATAFVLELLPTYAPDLLPSPPGPPSSPPASAAAAAAASARATVVGLAIGGPSPNLTTVFRAMNGRDTAGLALASLVGVTRQWPPAREFLLSRLRAEGPRNATGFLAVGRMSGAESLFAYWGHNVYDYFVGGERDVFAPLVRAVIDADAVMGVHGPPAAAAREVPVFVYKAVRDEMSAVGETDALVEGYCGKGARVLYHRNELGGHNDELWSGRLRTMDFLAHVLDDKRSANMTVPAPGECRTENVSVPLDVRELLPDWWIQGTVPK